MPSGVRTLAAHVCPNLHCGCIRPDKKVWKMKKSYDKHVILCNKKVGEPKRDNQKDIWAFVKNLESRIVQLEKDNASLKVENLELRTMLQGEKRGRYKVRSKSCGVPLLGWANFTQSAFEDGMQLVATHYTKTITSVQFGLLPVIWYYANKQAHVVREDPNALKDRFGKPMTVVVNRKSEQRTVTMKAAIRTVFQTHWLPPWEEVHSVLHHLFESQLVPHMEKNYRRIYNFTRYEVKTWDTSSASYTERLDVILGLMAFGVKVAKKSRAERQQEWWDDMVEETQYWYTCQSPEELAETYDDLFDELPIYKTTMRKYLNLPTTRSDKKQRYIDAGGQHYAPL